MAKTCAQERYDVHESGPLRTREGHPTLGAYGPDTCIIYYTVVMLVVAFVVA